MTTPVESELRQGLRDLANQPGPPNLADKALESARRTRRWRVALAAAGVLILAGAIGAPLLGMNLGISPGTLFGGADPAACETATDEADPPQGVAHNSWPGFVTIVVSKLPTRDDYTLQSAVGVCDGPSDINGPAANKPSAYAVINLGPNRENGHLTVTLRYQDVLTCGTVGGQGGQVLFCEPGTTSTPTVFGISHGGVEDEVTAQYPDGRTISLGNNETPLTVEQLKVAVTDAQVADLLL